MAANTKRAKKVRLGIFDIDGTIFRSSLIIELFNELIRRGIFPAHAGVEVERTYIAWLNRTGHYNDYLMKLVAVFYKNMAGRSIKQIEPAVRSVIAWQKDRVYRYPRHLIADLRKKGYFILVISNSPEPMVKRFAQSMKFDAAIGHVLEMANGVYTGHSIVNGELKAGTAVMDKVAVLKHFIAEHNMHVDLKHSVMIGDSEGDLPLLSYVGQPIAFNPSLPLARIAQKRKWQIVVERKDVVYRIRTTDFISVPGQEARVPYGNKKP